MPAQPGAIQFDGLGHRGFEAAVHPVERGSEHGDCRALHCNMAYDSASARASPSPNTVTNNKLNLVSRFMQFSASFKKLETRLHASRL